MPKSKKLHTKFFDVIQAKYKLKNAQILENDFGKPQIFRN